MVIGTRPALNLLVAAVGGAPARVATEHTDPRVYTPLLRREIRRRYGALDAVAVLGDGVCGRFETSCAARCPCA